MSTANHYFLDAVAGGVVMLLGYGAVRLLALAGFVSFPNRLAVQAEAVAEPAPA
jgi:hypothetical protein